MIQGVFSLIGRNSRNGELQIPASYKYNSLDMSSKIAKCSYAEELRPASILVNDFFIEFIINLSLW